MNENDKPNERDPSPAEASSPPAINSAMIAPQAIPTFFMSFIMKSVATEGGHLQCLLFVETYELLIIPIVVNRIIKNHCPAHKKSDLF